MTISVGYRSQISDGYLSPISKPGSGSPPSSTITPTAAYYYNNSNFGLAFDQALTLADTPGYTVAGKAVIAASSNNDVNGVTCQISAASAAVSGSVVVPSNDPGVLFGGLYVTAGSYVLEVPPALTNSVAPALSGYSEPPLAGQSINCGTGSWTGYGATLASFTYQWRESANGTTGWANIGGETTPDFNPDNTFAGKYLRCRVTASVGGGAGATEDSDVIGPIVGTWEWTDQTANWTVPVSGDYQISAIGAGGNGGTANSSTAASGGGGGAFGGGLYTLTGSVVYHIAAPGGGAGGGAGVYTGTGSASTSALVRGASSTGYLGGMTATSVGQVTWVGGDGASSEGHTPGGGGGAAGPSGAGSSASGQYGGAGASPGGNGGDGGENNFPGIGGSGGDGTAPGGGGGGGGAAGGGGGTGAPGWVKITGPL